MQIEMIYASASDRYREQFDMPEVSLQDGRIEIYLPLKARNRKHVLGITNMLD